VSERYHFIGIGGIGMGALASLLLAKGHHVSGSDLKENELTKQLKDAGARVHIGHDARNIDGATCIVLSSAIAKDNPEVRAAQSAGIRFIHRAQLLASLMNEHLGITVAGAHGKTTTTSMIAHLLMSAQLHPTIAVGGIVMGIKSNARLGAGKYFVAEVDESDRSFLHFNPKYSVITNIDFEHVDQYKDLEEIIEVYAQFIRCTQKDGLIFACGEDPNLLRILKREKRPFKTYGLSNQFDIYATDVRYDRFSSSFECHMDGKNLGKIDLEVPGKHNVLNCLAAIGVARQLGIDWKTIASAMNTFRGVKRRFQQKTDQHNILVIDDYAHHPTEIAATLAAAADLGRSRILVAFQPHRYSRLQALYEEFAKSLSATDYVIITDVYAASEAPIEGVNALKLVEKIKKLTNKPVIYLKKDAITAHLLKIAQPGDVILTLGAGDITHLSDQLAEGIGHLVFAKAEKAV
jgi:UDP-N-acetylmuramate--alanine ligase